MHVVRQTSDETTDRLMRCAAVFVPDALPRDGRIAFWDPEGAVGPMSHFGYPGPGGTPYTVTDITVVVPDGDGGARTRTVPAVELPVADAVPLLARARHRAVAHPATRAWGPRRCTPSPLSRAADSCRA